MIGVKINGRLGNQMFQYAFAYAQAKKHATTFFLDIASARKAEFKLNKYLELRPGEKLIMAFARLLHWLWFKRLKSYNECKQTGWSKVTEILTQERSNVKWEGFFQSEKYFSPYANHIRTLFSIKRKYRKVFLTEYENIFANNKILVLHIRRTDYLFHGSELLGGKDLSLPMSYYEQCLDLIDNLSAYYIIVLSDDLEYVKNYFAHRSGFYFIHNEEIVDFQIMQHADQLIISNSSFAWWAAYLNQKNAKVYAPKNWLGFRAHQEYPRGIMTKKFNWTQV